MQGFIKECLHQLHRICIDAAAAGFPDHRHMPVALCIFDQPENSRIAGQLIPVRVQRAPARRYLLIGIALQNQRRYTSQTIGGVQIAGFSKYDPLRQYSHAAKQLPARPHSSSHFGNRSLRRNKRRIGNNCLYRLPPALLRRTNGVCAHTMSQ